MASIGNPDEYVCVLERTINLPSPTAAYSARRKILYELPWESITWNRVENEVSTCQVDLSNDAYGRTCCTYPLQGWFQSIGVYRNGERVWWGPLMGWRTKDDTLSLAAMDMLAFAKRRFLPVDRTYEAVEGFTALAELAQDIEDNTGYLTDEYGIVKVPWPNINPANTYPGSLSGFDVTRTYQIAAFTSFFDVLTDLHNEYGLYFSAGPDHVFYVPNEFVRENAMPVVNERTALTKPQISVDCFNVASDSYLAGRNNGTGGYAKIINMNTILGTNGYASPFSLDAKIEAPPRASDVDIDFGYAGFPGTVEGLAPTVTLEAITLHPSFGSLQSPYNNAFNPMQSGFGGINWLVPGAFAAAWGFETDCASDVPTTGIDPFRVNPFDYLATDRIEKVRLAQLNVSVTKTGDDLNETISASFVPYAGP